MYKGYEKVKTDYEVLWKEAMGPGNRPIERSAAPLPAKDAIEKAESLIDYKGIAPSDIRIVERLSLFKESSLNEFIEDHITPTKAQWLIQCIAEHLCYAIAVQFVEDDGNMINEISKVAEYLVQTTSEVKPFIEKIKTYEDGAKFAPEIHSLLSRQLKTWITMPEHLAENALEHWREAL